jgi:DNA replication regulator DPB11
VLALTQANIVDARQRVQDVIADNGGNYQADLTKQVTHLLAVKPDGKKYQYARQWGLKVVSFEWLSDSIERGMVLEEELYALTIPERLRGKDAWIRRTASGSSLGKRIREDGEATEQPGKRKLRRTASQKLSSQSSALWDDIVGDGGTLAKQARVGDWDETSERPGPPKKPSEGKQMAPPLLLNEAISRHNPTPGATLDLKHTSSKTGTRRGLFASCRICVHGFSPKQVSIVKLELRKNEGFADVFSRSLQFCSSISPLMMPK